MIRAALLALLLVAVAAAPAHAGVRADAKRLARINLLDQQAVSGDSEAVLAEFEAELEACPAKPPEGQELATAFRHVSLYLRAVVSRSDAAFARSAKRLRAFRTSDRRLRRLARAMAHTNSLVRVLGEAPPRPCPYFEAWKAAGWAKDFRISPPVRNFTAAEVASLRRDARIVRGELKRLRRLGVSRRGVEALRDGWSGDELFAELAL